MGVILDTTILIDAERRGHTVPEILEQIRLALESPAFVIGSQTARVVHEVGLSVITIAELTHGAWRAKTNHDRKAGLDFVDVLSRAVPVYPVTLTIARDVGRIQAELLNKGIKLDFPDLAIGATALRRGFSVATANVRHFEQIPGLRVNKFQL